LIRAPFVEQSKRSARFVHHNLVCAREARAFGERDIYYTVSDYLDGATLCQALEDRRTFEPRQIIKLIRQVAEALTPLHEAGVPHAGIKPSNIFLLRNDKVVLGEPSLRAPMPSLDLPRLAYDFRYVPPELRFDGSGLEPRSDFYALGCVA